MLKQRIITAAILVLLFALALFELSSEYFSLLIALIALLAAWEWCDLVKINAPTQRVLFLLALIVPMLWIQFWPQFLELSAQTLELSVQHLGPIAKEAGLTTIGTYLETVDVPDLRTYSGIIEWLFIIPVLFWVLIMILIRNTASELLTLKLTTRYQTVIGLLVLFFTWMFLTHLRTFYEREWVLYFLMLICIADISAYFIGKKYGTTKMAPEISPGKTIAGFYGALGSGAVSGIVLALMLILIYDYPLLVAIDLVLLSVLTVLISIYGDLFFSLIKRRRGVKDSGSLLPGHGGVLDRIDSIVAAAPFFYAGIFLIYR